ncbi:hypothetical protein [Bacteroides sp. UBA939]|uniref:hypothetical protein n=1 Tax=Bacteroides sp. UBA939 TaxID=1946092 RepID=UPI0025BB958F|nr:hypothetical protein [Bacteroides sp. UBA939]
MKRNFLLTTIVGTALLFAGCGKDKEPPVPVVSIGTQPTAPAALVEGNISGSLTIAATATEGAVLTYQWYSNTTANNTGSTKLDGATLATYTFPATLTAGTYYYFCEVGAKGAVTVRSSVVTVTVNAPTPLLVFTDNVDYDIPASTIGTAITDINVAGGVSDGTTPYMFTATGLPTGITISTAGVISGTPTTTAGAGTATIKVEDSSSPKQSKEITINYGEVTAPGNDVGFGGENEVRW